MLLRSLLLLLFMVPAHPAAAELIEIDLQAPGDKLVVRDTVTGLDWLKHSHVHTVTANSIPNYAQVVAALPGIAGGPWAYATTSEMQDLYGRHTESSGGTTCPIQDVEVIGSHGEYGSLEGDVDCPAYDCLEFFIDLAPRGIFDDGNPLDGVGLAGVHEQLDAGLEPECAVSCTATAGVQANALWPGSLAGYCPPVLQPWTTTTPEAGHYLVREGCANACDDADACTLDRCEANGCENAPIQSVACMPPEIGDLVVLNLGQIPNLVLYVDPVTGDRIELTSYTVGTGPDLDADDIETGGASDIWVLDSGGRRVVEVDPATGDRTILSGCPDVPCNNPVGSGPSISSGALSLARVGNDLLLLDTQGLFLVDGSTGDRTFVSGCDGFNCSTSRGSGPSMNDATAVVNLGDGRAAVATDSIFPEILEVDLATGDRSVLSGPFVGGGPQIQGTIRGMALRSNSPQLLVATDSIGGGTGSGPAVVAVDATSGQRSELSGPVAGSGPALWSIRDVAVAADLSLWALANGGLITIDAATGDRTVVSSTGVGSGPGFSSPHALAAVGSATTSTPVPLLPRALLALLGLGLVILLGSRRRVRR